MSLRWNEEKGELLPCKSDEFSDDLPSLAKQCSPDAILIALMLGRVADAIVGATAELEKLGTPPAEST